MAPASARLGSNRGGSRKPLEPGKRNGCPAIRCAQDREVSACLSDIDLFDPLFFQLSSREACRADPRQRLFLEAAYQAAEHAGYGGHRLRGSNSGVFVGAGVQDYLNQVAPQELHEHWATAANPSTLPSRLSYFLDLKGPAIPVDTACSSALVAVHLAVESLRRGECEFAFAGGVHLNLSLLNFAAFRQMGALSASGRCRAFDDRADGFVPSEGVGVVLLRPLKAALAAGDTIYGVIKGSAINNDGRTNGLTAPNPRAQEAVLIRAWQDAGIEPQSLSYLEAHGTGTSLGDPIEVEALSAAFGRFTTQRQFCQLGAVKTNIGHCEAAAGMASLIKVLLCLEHRQLPPTLHFEAPNRHIQFEQTPLVVADRLRDWRPPDGQPRRAGISAFGFSGTNVHLVVEEPPVAPGVANPPERAAQLFVVAARSGAALRQSIEAYRRYLQQAPAAELADLCFTAQVGRFHGKQRLAIVARYRDQLADKLELLCLKPELENLPGSSIFLGSASDEAGLARFVQEDLARQEPSLLAQVASFCHGVLWEEIVRPGLPLDGRSVDREPDGVELLTWLAQLMRGELISIGPGCTPAIVAAACRCQPIPSSGSTIGSRGREKLGRNRVRRSQSSRRRQPRASTD